MNLQNKRINVLADALFLADNAKDACNYYQYFGEKNRYRGKGLRRLESSTNVQGVHALSSEAPSMLKHLTAARFLKVFYAHKTKQHSSANIIYSKNTLL